MWLLIDAGNTRIKWAIHAPTGLDDSSIPGEFRASGSCSTTEPHGLAKAWRPFGPVSALISNVAGTLVREALESQMSQIGITSGSNQHAVHWLASTAQLAGIVNDYALPTQLGTDRFASAIGARRMFPGQALVVATFGTATTLDTISADGHFLGGMILPGLRMMAKALSLNTAQLPDIGVAAHSADLLADNTHEAILSGCVNAQLGAVERTLRLMQQRSGTSDVQLLVSGGAAPALKPWLPATTRWVDNLVLSGLQAVVDACPSHGPDSC